jgi:SAM-dependent methyltransferase
VSGDEQIVAAGNGDRFAMRPIDCPTCGEQGKRVLGQRGGRSQRYGLGVETRIVECDRCSLLFPDPFPFPLDPARLYADPDKYFAAHDEAAKVQAYRGLIREISARTGKPQPSMLDVGSGRAELLQAARLEGSADVVGLEFAPDMIEYARSRHGLVVLARTIEQYAREADRMFDAIVLNAVLEHVHDPDSMIASAALLTRPGSVLYIDVPREPNLMTLVGNAWNRWRGSRAVYNLQPTWPPYHVFGFNERALDLLLSKHGFEITSLRIRSAPRVPARDEWRDRLQAFVATQINRAANWTGTASNMFVWARRR